MVGSPAGRASGFKHLYVSIVPVGKTSLIQLGRFCMNTLYLRNSNRLGKIAVWQWVALVFALELEG